MSEMNFVRIRLFSFLGGASALVFASVLSYQVIDRWPEETPGFAPPEGEAGKPRGTPPKRSIEEFSPVWTCDLRAELVEKAPKVTEEQEAPLGLELLGTILEPSNNFAMVRTSSGQTVFCRNGDTLGEARIVEIRPDAITVVRGEKKIELVVRKQK